jgi:hypothetical protein
MKLINDIQIDVKQISIFNNNLAGKHLKKFKRLIFLADIKDIGEYCYFFDGKIFNCSVIAMRDGDWFKVADKYEDLSVIMIEWYKLASEREQIKEQ